MSFQIESTSQRQKKNGYITIREFGGIGKTVLALWNFNSITHQSYAEVDMSDKYGWKPLYVAAEKG